TATERVMTPIRRLAAERGVPVEEFVEMFAAEQVPVGRLATADEMATWIAVMASGIAGFVTGTQLLVDGGASRAICRIRPRAPGRHRSGCRPGPLSGRPRADRGSRGTQP